VFLLLLQVLEHRLHLVLHHVHPVVRQFLLERLAQEHGHRVRGALELGFAVGRRGAQDQLVHQALVVTRDSRLVFFNQLMDQLQKGAFQSLIQTLLGEFLEVVLHFCFWDGCFLISYVG